MMMPDEPVMICLGACWGCGRVFEFDPDTVPSISIDPVTRRPPDMGADGQPCEWDPEAAARATREPFCPACIAHIEARRAELNLPPWPTPPGSGAF